MKKVLSLAIAAALVAPAAAMADATIYGKVRQSVDIVDIEVDGDTLVDEIQINDKTSRIGFKGSEDLGNGLTAVWTIEYGVKISGGGNGPDLTDDNEFSPGDTLSARNAFVGLAGGFGTVAIGRHDTPLKMSTGSLDYFGDTVVDNNEFYTEALVDRRADGTIAYISPSFGGLTVAAALVPGEKTSVAPGDTEANGIADAYSIAAMYSNGGLYVSGAIENADGNIDAIGADGADLSQVRVGAGYDFGMFKVAGVYETVGVDNPAGGDDLVDSTSMNLNGSVKLGGGELVAKWFDYEDDSNPEDDHDGFGIGYHYSLSKRTQVMANYVSSSFDDVDSGVAGDQDADISVFSFQLNHNF